MGGWPVWGGRSTPTGQKKNGKIDFARPPPRATGVVRPPPDRPVWGWPNHPRGLWGWFGHPKGKTNKKQNSEGLAIGGGQM